MILARRRSGVAERPFRSPPISQGYPLNDEERRQVRLVARSGRWVVRSRDGGWEVRRDGAIRASARTTTQQEAREKARDIVRRSGGGEVIVHRKDGSIRDRDTVAPDRDSTNR
jgi:hypothetical protein